MWFELFKDTCPVTKTPWRWRLRNGDGAVIAVSVSGHPSEEECKDAIGKLKLISHSTPVETRGTDLNHKLVKKHRS